MAADRILERFRQGDTLSSKTQTHQKLFFFFTDYCFTVSKSSLEALNNANWVRIWGIWWEQLFAALTTNISVGRIQSMQSHFLVLDDNRNGSRCEILNYMVPQRWSVKEPPCDWLLTCSLSVRPFYVWTLIKKCPLRLISVYLWKLLPSIDELTLLVICDYS